MQTPLAEAQSLTRAIIQNYRPEKVILFGSAGRGDKTVHDIDLLIIKQSTKKKPYRIKEVFEATRSLKRDYPFDPLVYTPSEIAKRVSLGDLFIRHILSEGKVLYE